MQKISFFKNINNWELNNVHRREEPRIEQTIAITRKEIGGQYVDTEILS